LLKNARRVTESRALRTVKPKTFPYSGQNQVSTLLTLNLAKSSTVILSNGTHMWVPRFLAAARNDTTLTSALYLLPSDL